MAAADANDLVANGLHRSNGRIVVTGSEGMHAFGDGDRAFARDRTAISQSLAKLVHQPAEVRTGREGGGKTEILEGLAAGEKVVASGQFLLDSEASLTGIPARKLGTGQ